MPVDPLIHRVFGYFQNLNLLALIQDLRSGRAIRGAWATGKLLCPISHGMPVGQRVYELCFLGETAELERACDYAARQMGADSSPLVEFVRRWDGNRFSAGWLLGQLEELWHERLADAVAVQDLLQGRRSDDAHERRWAKHAQDTKRDSHSR